MLEALRPSYLLLNLAGVSLGILVGAMPGLNATICITLLLPFTFYMSLLPSLILLVGIFCGGIYGGSITAILFSMPGTPGAVMTLLDGHPLSKKGLGRMAIGTSTLGSMIGGLVSGIFLIVCSPFVADIALTFSGPEYFALAVLGLTLIFSISHGSLVKGSISAVLGLLFAAVGMDQLTPSSRLSFGNTNLMIGLGLIPAICGLYAVSEVFKMLASGLEGTKVPTQSGPLLPPKKDILQSLPTILKSSLIGTIIGAIPGTGAQVAAIVSYAEAKRSSKRRAEFGTGAVEGVFAAETANNAVTGGALVPMLTLGIPGDAVTAVIMGALVIQGLQPGPMLFKTMAGVMNIVFLHFMLSTIFMGAMGLAASGAFARLAMMDRKILGPVIIVIAFLGTFAMRNSVFDLKVALFFGLLGYFLERYRYPIPPLVLGLILGPLTERSLRQSLILSHGDLSILISKPVPAVALLIAAISVVVVGVGRIKAYSKKSAVGS